MKSLRSFMLLKARAFPHERSGNFALIAALLMLPILGAVGLVVDVTGGLAQKNHMQGVADSAALAAAASGTAREDDVIAVANNFLAAHLGDGQAENAAENDDWVANVTLDQNIVGVAIEDDYPTFFMNLFGFRTIPISVVAKAATAPASTACILILDPAKADALKIINANSVASECGFQVNSTHAQRAFYIENGGKFSAPLIAVSGKSKLGSGKKIVPPPVDGSPAVADPLAGMAEPIARTAACTSKSLKTINSQTKISIDPGVYCGGLTLNATDEVTLKPGVYTFRNGPFTMNTSAKVIGKGVQFYFEDAQSPLLMNGSAIFQVSAPATGSHAGILMFQGRKAKDSNVQFRINTSAGSFYDGVIYLPYTVIDWNVSGSLNAESSYTALISKVLNLYVSGTAYFKKPKEGEAVVAPSGLASAGKVRLVE